MGRTSLLSLLRAGWSHMSRFLLALPIWVWADRGCPGETLPLSSWFGFRHTLVQLPALPLCPGRRGLLVQIRAKSRVSLGMGQSRGFLSLAQCWFILWASSPNPSALCYRHCNPAREAFKNKRRDIGEAPTAVQPSPRLPRCCSDGNPGMVMWGRLCRACSSPRRCPRAGRVVLSFWERIII